MLLAIAIAIAVGGGGGGGAAAATSTATATTTCPSVIIENAIFRIITVTIVISPLWSLDMPQMDSYVW